MSVCVLGRGVARQTYAGERISERADPPRHVDDPAQVVKLAPVAPKAFTPSAGTGDSMYEMPSTGLLHVPAAKSNAVWKRGAAPRKHPASAKNTSWQRPTLSTGLVGGAQTARNDAEPGAFGDARQSPPEKAATSAHSLQSELQRKETTPLSALVQETA